MSEPQETPTGNVANLSVTRKPLISYILLAEFDVDRGSVMRYQHPRELVAPPPSEYLSHAIKYDELVANMMLPDGVQNQIWEHNNFLLHRPPDHGTTQFLNDWEVLSQEENAKLVDLAPIVTDSPEDSKMDATLFAFNVIRCFKDAKAKRGAVIQALAVLSEFPALCLSDGWATGLLPLLRKALALIIESPHEIPFIFSELYLSSISLQ
jgi:hypothetical protein